MSKKVKRLLCVYICVAAGIVVLGVLIVGKKFGPQENIFFLEYESEYENEDTLIFRYNSENDIVDEVGKVQGRLFDCVVNSDETYITGLVLAKILK
ncbi:MAG: hypothetical protein K2O34_14320 [Acetatifactor sp.]|nr:hypothetical protein [Acetatifactor sp.]